MRASVGLWLSFAMLASTVGCVAERHVPINESQFVPYAGTVSSTITGQAFLKTRSGDVKFGAGDRVILIPVTDYTEEDYDRAVVGNETLKKPAPADMAILSQYIRSTIADASGIFEFKSIPSGNYFVECQITWEVPSGYYSVTTGAVAHCSVSVEPGETVKVIATR